MGFYCQYPASASGSNASVGTNGAPIPGSSTLVAGENPSGDQQPLQTNSSGELLVDITGSLANPLPVTDAAAEASLASIDTTSSETATNTLAISASVASIDTKTPALVAGSVPVHVDNFPATQPVSGTVTVVQPTGTNLHTVVDASALPTGAATEANQTTANASLSSIDSKLTSPLTVTGPLTDTQLRATPVPVSVTSTTITGNVTVVQPTGTNLHTVIDSGTISLPSGASTAANQATEIASLASIDGKLADNYGAATAALRTAAQIGNASGAADFGAGNSSAQTVRVVVATDQATIPTSSTQAGYVKANAPFYQSYSSVNVTTSAYVQLVASTSAAIKQLQIFDSSGQALYLAVGAAASEVDQIIIPPGGAIVNLAIAASSRISIKAVTATANSGYIAITFLG